MDSDISQIRKIEGERFSKNHIRVMLIAGMSFFTDAYDLFIIGIVLLMLKPIFDLSATQIGLVASAALFGAVIGPVVFGTIGDRFGRKSTYWITVAILIIGALGSATSMNYLQLIVWRFVLGVGIGGDYPLSATIVAEYANRKDRGKMVASTFAMQGFGLVAGVGIGFLLLMTSIPTTIIWRLLLAFGAIPTLLIIKQRTKLYETPWYNLSKGKTAAAAPLAANTSGRPQINAAAMPRRKLPEISLKRFVRTRWQIVLGTSITWFLMDISYYGTAIFTPYLASLFGFSGIFASTQISALILILAAVPGYWVAVALIDKQGRKSMQVIGFLAMGICFIILFLSGNALLAASMPAFFAIYGLSFFFTNYGPNTTTYVYPTELYPTSVRARGHGIAAMSGKLGAALSALFFPVLLIGIGKFNLIGVLGAVALLGAVLTLLLLPETKKRSLLETSMESELSIITADLNREFNAMLSIIHKTSLMLKNEFANNRILAEKSFRMAEYNEHAADATVHNIINYISNTKVNTRIYTDISHLARRLDDIIDGEKTLASRLYVYDITSADEFMKKFADLNLRCVLLVKEGVDTLGYLPEGKAHEEKVFRIYREASSYESRADDLLRESLREVMKWKDPVKIMKYKEIYEVLESITDRCMNSLGIINDITLRYMYGPYRKAD